MIDQKIIIGAIVVGVVMTIITIVGSAIGNRDESEKKIIYKKENSWIWQPQKNQ